MSFTSSQFHNSLASFSGKLVTEDDKDSIRGLMMSSRSRGPAALYLFEIAWGAAEPAYEDWRKSVLEDMDVEKVNSKLRSSWDKLPLIEHDFPGIQAQVLKLGLPDDFTQRSAILPSEDPHFSCSIPLSCGLRSMRFHLAMEEAGIGHANRDCAAFGLAHLYNAARQLGLLQSVWPQMERFIALNMLALFSGQLPHRKQDFKSRYEMKYGSVMSDKIATAKNGRNRSRLLKGADHVLKTKNGNRGGPQLAYSKISSILRDVYQENSNTNIYQCLEKLQAIFQPIPTKSGHRQPQLTSLQLLQLLRTSLPTAVENARFDYFKFTKQSEHILKRLRFTFVADLGMDYYDIKEWKAEHGELEEQCIDGFTSLPNPIGIAHMVGETLEEVIVHGDQYPHLRCVAKVLEKYIAGLESN